MIVGTKTQLTGMSKIHFEHYGCRFTVLPRQISCSPQNSHLQKLQNCALWDIPHIELWTSNKHFTEILKLPKTHAHVRCWKCYKLLNNQGPTQYGNIFHTLTKVTKRISTPHISSCWKCHKIDTMHCGTRYLEIVVWCVIPSDNRLAETLTAVYNNTSLSSAPPAP